MNTLFNTELPEDLSSITTEDLTALLDASVDVVRGVRDNENTLPEGMDEDSFATGCERIGVARTELASRADAEDEAEADTEAVTEQTEEADRPAVADLAATALDGLDDADESEEGDADGDAEDETETTEAETEDESEAEAEDNTAEEEDAVDRQEAVAADAGRGRRAASVPGRYRPRQRRTEEDRGLSLVAASDFRGISAGSPFRNREQLVEAFMDKHDAVSASQIGKEGILEDCAVARVPRQYRDNTPSLTADASGMENRSKIIQFIGGEPGSHEQVSKMGGKALTADSGLCAPLTPRYDIPVFGSTATPVIDSLPTIPSARGGIRYFGQMGWKTGANTIDDAISHLTKDQLDLGGTNAVKSYQEIVCPTDNSAYVDAWVKRVRVENLKARAWPELVDAFLSNLDVAYAAGTETNALDKIAATMTHAVTINALGNLSFLSNLTAGIIKLTAGIRSRNRLDRGTRFRLLCPEWVLDALVGDTLFSQMDRFRTEAEVRALFAKANVEVTFYMDTATGGGQLFGAQGAAEVTDYPATARLYLWVEGSIVRFELPGFDFGIVRDSALNSVNQYEMFVEDFNGYANIGGPESYEIDAAVTPTGMTAGTMSVNVGSL